MLGVVSHLIPFVDAASVIEHAVWTAIADRFARTLPEFVKNLRPAYERPARTLAEIKSFIKE